MNLTKALVKGNNYKCGGDITFSGMNHNLFVCTKCFINLHNTGGEISMVQMSPGLEQFEAVTKQYKEIMEIKDEYKGCFKYKNNLMIQNILTIYQKYAQEINNLKFEDSLTKAYSLFLNLYKYESELHEIKHCIKKMIKQAKNMDKCDKNSPSNDNIKNRQKGKIVKLANLKYENIAERYKILIVGDLEGNKSSFIHKIVNDKHGPTCPIEFESIFYRIDKSIFKLNFCEINDYKNTKSFLEGFYKDCNAILFVYDITKKGSLSSIETLIKNTQAHCNLSYLKCLIGSNLDQDDKRQVVALDVKKFLKKHSFDYHIETSIKTGVNLDKMVKGVCNLLSVKPLQSPS